MKKYKLYIDRDKCIGCGTCVSLMPEIFEIDDADGLIRAHNSKAQGGYFILEIDEGQLEEFKQIAESCPTQVFRIE
jgi:ferredoxin